MKKLPLLLCGSLLVFAACKKGDSTNNLTTPTPDPNPCVSGTAATGNDVIAGRYIVAYQSGQVSRVATEASLEHNSENLLQRHGIEAGKLRAVFAGEPGGFVAELSEAEAAVLQSDPAIKVIEPDRIIALANCFTIAEPRLITWNVNRVGYGDGRGKTAWIIDSGIDMDHPDLVVDAARSRSFIGGNSSPDDENGHGTHVAGIIGAVNNSIGVLGVASGASVVSMRVMGADGKGALSSIIQALAFINTNATAGDVVNMSLGLEAVSPTLNEQVQNTAARGIYIAIAAGNDGQPANKYSPGSTNGTNIYTVSATDSLNRFASFSNYGNDVVDYAAPGVGILSTYMGGQYARMSGTSMAAPHVAGLLLLKGSNLSGAGLATNDPDGAPDAIVHY